MSTVYERANAIFKCWIFSLYLESNLTEGKIPLEIFSNPLRLMNNGQEIAVIQPFRVPNVTGEAHNLSNITKGSCFLAFDKALDEIFKEKHKKNFAKHYLTKPEGTLRVIIYMMRCAFAHNPALPVWDVKGDYQNVGVLKIPEIKFELDITQLDGKPLDESQININQVLELMLYCLKIIKKCESNGLMLN